MNDHLPDLSARARRGALTDAERRQLRLILAGSLEAQLAHRAGREFDQEDSVLPGDDALAARVTARLLAQVRPSPPTRLRRAWRLVLAAALTVAAAAAGPSLVARLGGGSAPSAVPGEVATTASTPAPLPPFRPGASRPAPSVEPTPAAPSAPATPSTSLPPRAPLLGSATPIASSHDAPAAIFAAASRARRDGQTARAMALYQELQRRHPTAAEARAADIALGMLYADAAPARALTHYRRYLDHGGPLAPEALWGQARALSALGRTAEARESWRALVVRYPRSTYANAARTKLEPDP